MCVFSREGRCTDLAPRGATGQWGWEQLISSLLTIFVIVPSVVSRSLEEFPANRDRILLSSLPGLIELYAEINTRLITEKKSLATLSGESPFPVAIDLVSGWVQNRKAAGGDVVTVFWGTVIVYGHAIAYRMDLNDRSVEVFDSDGWGTSNMGAYNFLFEEGARFIRLQTGSDGPILRFLVNPFSLRHGGSCGPWTAVYFLFRATLSREQTISFFESAGNASDLGGAQVYGEEDFSVGSLSRVVFLCTCRVWRLCYELIWSPRGEAEGRMLGQGPIWERAQALMRVVCGCQTYEEIRATLKECLTPVGSLLPKPFRDRLGIITGSEILEKGSDDFRRGYRMDELVRQLRYAQKSQHLQAVTEVMLTYLCRNRWHGFLLAECKGIDLQQSPKFQFMKDSMGIIHGVDFKIGDRVDAQDPYGKWFPATFAEIRGRKNAQVETKLESWQEGFTEWEGFIDYEGWNDKYNEWIGFDSGRLALFGTKSHLYRCPKGFDKHKDYEKSSYYRFRWTQ